LAARAPSLASGEIQRRYENVRAALKRDGLDAALVSGSEYTGFEGAVTYLSGFQIVHRYAYVLLPLEGDPAIVFPSEARATSASTARAGSRSRSSRSGRASGRPTACADSALASTASTT
jgi:Creatinase/Prolidase N-terminal domain